MEVDAFIAMLIAASALMGGPGPATLSVAAAAAAFGVRRALPYYCGVCCGTSTIVILVGTGVTGLVLAVPGAAPVLVGLAGLYIIYLAFRIATAKPVQAADGGESAPAAIAGYLFAIANPKGYAAIGAVFSGFVLIASSPTGDAITKAVFLIGMVFVVNTVWLFTGSVLAGAFRSPRSARVLNVTFALLLILSVVVLFV